MAKEQSLRSLLDLQQNQLDLVFSDGDSIDTKALAILAINVALLLFIAQSSLHFHSWWQYGLLLAPYLLSLGLDGFAIWPTHYRGNVPLNEHPEYLSMESETLLLQLLADTQLAVEINAAFNRRRWQYCLGSLLLTAFGLVALFAIL
jgi:hypothetical protein